MTGSDVMGAPVSKRAVLVFPRANYRVEAYVAAARRLGVELTLVTDSPDACERFALPSVRVDFAEPQAAAEAVARSGHIDGVIATDEPSAVVAAHIARRLGLPYNDPAAALATRNKRLMRERLASAGARTPRFRVVELHESAATVADAVRFPCVVKPPMLTGSQGVIRADNATELARAIARVRAILATSPSDANTDPAFFRLLVEDYLPGREVAVEALISDGELRPLALFDKPDALVGPYFEETIYVTPSRLDADAQARILDVTARAASALGLSHGPIHAELRVSGQEVSVVEVAARSIGGLCSRVLDLVADSLEALVIAHAVGLPLERELSRSEGASGVMMMPIARSGILRSVVGLKAARAVAGVTEVIVSARLGQTIRALPEGSSYLGFIFARGPTPHAVESALRASFAALCFDVAPLLPIALD